MHSRNIGTFIEQAKKHGIPTVVDPKKENFLAYQGTTLFKPNLKELREGLNIKDIHLNKLEEIQDAILHLEKTLNNRSTMVTLSERGVILSDQGEFIHRPAHLRNISDVSGAGDTVIAVASLCVALGLDATMVAELSNLAGGLVCEKRGVIPIDPHVLKTESIRIFSDK